MATKGNKADIPVFLIDHKANINARDIMANTPLHWAAKAGNKNLIDKLLSGGADINAKNISGHTPLDMASGSVKKLLIENGAKTSKELL